MMTTIVAMIMAMLVAGTVVTETLASGKRAGKASFNCRVNRSAHPGEVLHAQLLKEVLRARPHPAGDYQVNTVLVEKPRNAAGLVSRVGQDGPVSTLAVVYRDHGVFGASAKVSGYVGTFGCNCDLHSSSRNGR